MNLNNHSWYNSILPPFMGASIENVFRQPLTTLTVVMINERKNFAESALSLYRKGGAGRFYNGYQGFSISWLMRTSHRVATFGLNDIMYKNCYSNASITLAITAAEFATTAFGELILTVAQEQKTKQTPLELFKKRYQREGFNALTSGFLGNNMRNIIFNATLFGLKNTYSREMERHPMPFSAGITFTAVVASHPVEVVRSRKVKDPNLTYQKVVKDIFAESSFRGFSKGLFPRLISAGLGTFVTMLAVTRLA